MAKFNRNVREIKDMISQAKYGTEGLKLCLASFITQPDSFSSRHENLCSVIMNTCLHSARKWHRNLSDMWWPSTFKIGLREITILMCEQKVYPIRLHVNGRNDSHPNVVGPQCWGSLHPFAYACSLKFDLFQTLRNNSEKPATACKRVCKRTQSVTSNNVGNCWSTMLRPFARTGLTDTVTSPPPSRGKGYPE